MSKILYPAIFSTEKDGIFVRFPDLDGCCTQGTSIPDAYEMAEEALPLYIISLEDSKNNIPKPSDIKTFKLKDNEFASYISGDTLKYRKRLDNRAVKKTLTIPKWMNDEGKKRNINFSQVLQDALSKKFL